MIVYIKQSSKLSSTLRFAFSVIIVNEYNFFVDFKGVMYFDD
jgi:hypothetical protein